MKGKKTPTGLNGAALYTRDVFSLHVVLVWYSIIMYQKEIFVLKVLEHWLYGNVDCAISQQDCVYLLCMYMCEIMRFRCLSILTCSLGTLSSFWMSFANQTDSSSFLLELLKWDGDYFNIDLSKWNHQTSFTSDSTQVLLIWFSKHNLNAGKNWFSIHVCVCVCVYLLQQNKAKYKPLK